MKNVFVRTFRLTPLIALLLLSACAGEDLSKRDDAYLYPGDQEGRAKAAAGEAKALNPNLSRKEAYNTGASEIAGQDAMAEAQNLKHQQDDAKQEKFLKDLNASQQ